MVDCNFRPVLPSIETPDDSSLNLSRKLQNLRAPLVDSVHEIAHAGLRVLARFIISFDNGKSDAGRRAVQFVEEAAIPTAMFSMLQALPDNALWYRLE